MKMCMRKNKVQKIVPSPKEVMTCSLFSILIRNVSHHELKPKIIHFASKIWGKGKGEKTKDQDITCSSRPIISSRLGPITSSYLFSFARFLSAADSSLPSDLPSAVLVELMRTFEAGLLHRPALDCDVATLPDFLLVSGAAAAALFLDPRGLPRFLCIGCERVIAAAAETTSFWPCQAGPQAMSARSYITFGLLFVDPSLKELNAEKGRR